MPYERADLKQFMADEAVTEEMQKVNALVARYTKLIASADMDFNGERVNLAKLRAYRLSPDRNVRRAAYAKRSDFFVENDKELDDIFDRLVALRNDMAIKLGYENFVELGYIKMELDSYTPMDVKNFREAVKMTLVPFLAHLHEQRRKDLEVDRLKFYDENIFFATGNPMPKGTSEEMFEAGKRMYAELSTETKEFFDFMLENELFDILEYLDCAPDIAETHSMGMEFFIADRMRLFFGRETEKFLYMQLAAALAFIPYGCMVDEFQHIIYENPNMSPSERKAAWKKLEGEYMPHLDYEDDPFFGKGGSWQQQAHIYENPFYYINYCLAQFCAIQYRIWMETDRDAAWNSYIELMKKAGTLKFTDLIAEAGLESPLEPDCMDSIIIGVSKLLKKLKTRAIDKENCCCDE